MAGRWACIGAGYWPDLRSSRIREDTRSASRAAGLFLPKLALPADLFPIFDAIRRSSLRAGVPHLEPRDAPRLHRCRFLDCAPALGHPAAACLAFRRMEPVCWAKRVFDGFAPGRSSLVTRTAA